MRNLAAIAISLLFSGLGALPVLADDEDELVLLPGNGELRSPEDRERIRADRLKPGGGLFLTFDEDEDGRITPSEIQAGIPQAFSSADSNRDGYLTALEQRDWADALPTRDDSLANPTRFDPNLDRRVDLGEFTEVIHALSVDYADEATGLILLSSLRRAAGRDTEATEASRPSSGPRSPERRNRPDRS